MRCPECSAPREAASTACGKCGLIFVNLPAPSRRAADRASAHERRRADDVDLRECPVCQGLVPVTAIRCRHCAEILDRGYLARKARRRRQQVNAASWMAYLLGIVTLFIFPQVGMIAIGTGIALSVLYYLIPVEEDLPYEQPEDTLPMLRTYFKKQFRGERFAIPLPLTRRLKIVMAGTPLLAVVAGIAVNHVLLQQPLDRTLASSAIFRDVDVSARYEYWLVPGVVVYEVDAPEGSDVAAAVAELAQRTNDRQEREVRLRLGKGRSVALDDRLLRRMAGSDASTVVLQLRDLIDRNDDPELREALERRLGTSRPVPSTAVTIPVPSN